jgi:hypothetical protein
MNNSYVNWIERILILLRVTDDEFRQGKLPNGFLLGPPGDALSEEEVKELFNDIQNWLVDPQQIFSFHNLRNKTRSLNGTALLPLLFAMALIARRYGDNHFYWPEFQKHLLFKLKDLNVIYSISGDLTWCWWKLYELSRHTLYYPEEGLTNIKWPIAHAGIIAGDEHVLVKYGIKLHAETGDQPHPLLLGDIDEFLQDLLFWLLKNQSRAVLIRRLQNPHAGLATAEVAAKWLLHKWDELVQYATEEGSLAELDRIPRCHLSFDPLNMEVRVSLSEGKWKGKINNAIIIFKQERKLLPLAYDPGNNISYSKPIDILMIDPAWDIYINLILDGVAIKLPLIPSPFAKGKGALLFDADTGRKTRHWQSGQEYYLILPHDATLPDWVNTIFIHVLEYGLMQGAWNGYQVYFVVGSDLFEMGDDSGSTFLSKIKQLNEQLDEAGAALRLPGLAELLQPRLRPIASIVFNREGMPTFLFDDPPLFEITGYCTESLSLELQYWNSENRIFKTLDTCEIQPDLCPCIINPFSSAPPPLGLFRLQLGRYQQYDFQLIQQPNFNGETAHIELEFIPPDGIVGVGTSHSLFELNEGTFSVKAWSSAALTLEIVQDGQEHRTNMYLDNFGGAEYKFSNIINGATPERTCSVKVYCGHICSETHYFYLKPYIRHWDASYNESVVLVKGQVENPGIHSMVGVFLFGSEPWNGELWYNQCPLNAGQFQVEVNVNNVSMTKVIYVVIGTTRDIYFSSKKTKVANNNLVDEPPWLAEHLPWAFAQVDPLNFESRPNWDEWEIIAKYLFYNNVTVKDLYFRAAATVLMSLGLQECKQIMSSLISAIPSVNFLTSTLREDLPSLLETFKPPQLTLVHLRTPLPIKIHSIIQSLPGIELQLPLHKGFIDGSSFVPKELFVSDGDVQARVLVRSSEKPFEYIIKAEEDIVLCLSCHRIIPSNRFNSHASSQPYDERCRSMLPIKREKEFIAHLAVAYYPDTLVLALVDVVRIALEKGLEPKQYGLYTWLENLGKLYKPGKSYRNELDWLQQLGIIAAGILKLIIQPRILLDTKALIDVSPLLQDENNVVAVQMIIDRLICWIMEKDE